MSANGYLTAAELAPIGNGLFLHKNAAPSYLNMRDAAAMDGVNIHSTAKASAYRDRAMQVDMRVHPLSYGINPAMNALPGLPSGHGTGFNRDVPFGASNNWMIANAARFGWYRPARTIALNDLNHWERDPSSTAGNGGKPISADQPAPPPTKGPDMQLIQVAEDGEVDLVTDRGIVRIQQPSHRDLFVRMSNAAREGRVEIFAGPQRDVISTYLSLVGAADQAALLAALNKVGTVDTPSIVSAVVAAIKGSGTSVTDANVEAIALAVDAQLADNFSKLELKNQLK